MKVLLLISEPAGPESSVREHRMRPADARPSSCATSARACVPDLERAAPRPRRSHRGCASTVEGTPDAATRALANRRSCRGTAAPRLVDIARHRPCDTGVDVAACEWCSADADRAVGRRSGSSGPSLRSPGADRGRRSSAGAGEAGQHGSDDGKDEHVRCRHRTDRFDRRADQPDDDERELAASDQRGARAQLTGPAHSLTTGGELAGQHLGQPR